MIYHVTIGGRDFEVDMGPEGISIDGRRVEVGLYRADESPLAALHVDHATYPLLAERTAKGRWRIRFRGSPLEAEVVDERTKTIRDIAGAGAGPAGPRPIVAPMPGMVLRVEVTEGDRVVEGQGVIIVEAMKMENELRAIAPGVVSRVLVAQGEAVEKGQLLVELGAPDGES